MHAYNNSTNALNAMVGDGYVVECVGVTEIECGEGDTWWMMGRCESWRGLREGDRGGYNKYYVMRTTRSSWMWRVLMEPSGRQR